MGWIISKCVNTGECDVINKDYIVSFNKKQFDDVIIFDFELVNGTTQRVNLNLKEFDNKKVLKKFCKGLDIDYEDIIKEG